MKTVGSNLVYVAVLLMMLTFLVLLLVLLEGKKKKRNRRGSAEPVKTVTPPAVSGGRPVSPAVPVHNVGGGSIYFHVPRSNVRNCPGCDAENPLSQGQCAVCGCKMSPMGR